MLFPGFRARPSVTFSPTGGGGLPGTAPHCTARPSFSLPHHRGINLKFEHEQDHVIGFINIVSNGYLVIAGVIYPSFQGTTNLRYQNR